MTDSFHNLLTVAVWCQKTPVSAVQDIYFSSTRHAPNALIRLRDHDVLENKFFKLSEPSNWALPTNHARFPFSNSGKSSFSNSSRNFSRSFTNCRTLQRRRVLEFHFMNLPIVERQYLSVGIAQNNGRVRGDDELRIFVLL